ncbi:hypothetical protein OJ252_1749 [Cryptosporidium canis]|uniref:26S proteasome non-ATPase regulatory subunit RPN1 C-terminal domain-containing protein n=1 Tax=Cryptosporidium canis TaxID=195482 RepID=A0ABQ8P780_9CRYT|nr:hypothetical protein OJ252_1749 [Cryptosporidium canis]
MQRVLVEETLANGKRRTSEEDDQVDDDESDISVLVSVLNMALISLGEEIGSEMALRALDNVLQYSSVFIRRAVPISIAALSIGNPKPVLIDTISKLTHDSDPDNSQPAPTAGILLWERQARPICSEDCPRLSIHGQRPRDGEPLPHQQAPPQPDQSGGRRHDSASRPQTLVRVGQMVDTVGQAGNPRKITGFQTHNTPVLLGFNERAELAADEFVPVCSAIEDIVIIERNPDASEGGSGGKDE